MPDLKLPDGVERWMGHLVISDEGRYVRVADLPKIEAAAVERERERIRGLVEADLRHWGHVKRGNYRDGRVAAMKDFLAALDQEANDE
jgi:hypothetical protein